MLKTNHFQNLIVAIFFLILIMSQSLFSRELCRVSLDCPPNYANDTVVVPDNVVILSEIFEHCSPDSTVGGNLDTLTDTISLFIIIDHSSSMSKLDSLSNRFKLAQKVIDSVYTKSPASEVGIAVFSNKLMHNESTDSFFKTLGSSAAKSWNDAYVPLTPLNSDIEGAPAIKKIKWSIAIDSTTKDGAGNYSLVNADYQTSGRIPYTGGTDISLGFEAAKEAFSVAVNPENRRFILFISDGKHQTIDSERSAFEEDYISGTNTPTTYTAYFLNQGQPIPDQIKTMTTNIQNNGYSDNNYSSKVWSTDADEDNFLITVFTNIIGEGLKKYTSTPTQLIINNDTANSFDSLYAYFDTPLVPLNKSGSVDLAISYTYQWNSPLTHEETKDFTVTVMHGNNEDLEGVDCWDQGTLGFYSISSEIKTALPTQTDLAIRFYHSKQTTAPSLGSSIPVVLYNGNRTDSLSLELDLDASFNYYHANFTREYANPIADLKLQNLENDSLIAVFRNPQIPLDTVAYSIPVKALLDLTVTNTFYSDTDANGHPDMISVIQSGGQVLTQEDCDLIKSYTSVFSPRELGDPLELKSEAYGFSVAVSQKSDTIEGKTDLYLTLSKEIDEILSVRYKELLSSGNKLPFIDVQIQDSMAPVINSATYFYNQSLTIDDTFKVVFSEPCSTDYNTTPFNLSVGGSSLSPISPNLNYLQTINDTVVFTYTKTELKPLVTGLDSIWINISGGVSDKAGNFQTNTNNVKRKIDYYKIFTIKSASYLDNSLISDGLIDRISVKTNAPLDSLTLSSIKGEIKLNDNRSFEIHSYTITDSGFQINVTQPTNTTPITSVNDLDKISISNFHTPFESMILNTDIQIEDSLPPILLSGAFFPGFKSKSNEDVLDTLLVTFSEMVNTPPYISAQPFNFLCTQGDSSYSMTLTFLKNNTDNSSHYFTVSDKTKERPQKGDSLKIDITSKIADTNNIVQLNSNNRYANLHVNSSDLLLKVTVTSNPGLHTDTYILDGKEYVGIGIKVEILGNGWPLGVAMKGYLKIVDAVGNIVREINGIDTNDKSAFWFPWDARNHNNRLVHSGSYLGLVEIHNVTEKIKSEDTIMIGVKENME